MRESEKIEENILLKKLEKNKNVIQQEFFKSGDLVDIERKIIDLKVDDRRDKKATIESKKRAATKT